LEIALSVERITIPEDLLRLKPSDALESVSMSRLARTGTAVLRQITATAEAVIVKVQGQGAMVTLSQRQYDEMVQLICRIQEEKSQGSLRSRDAFWDVPVPKTHSIFDCH